MAAPLPSDNQTPSKADSYGSARSLANEHSVKLGPLSKADSAIMFLRRLPRSNLADFFRDEVEEVWHAVFCGEEERVQLRGLDQSSLRGKRAMLERVLERNEILTPRVVMRLCSLMRDPRGKRLQEALGMVSGESVMMPLDR